MTIRDNSGVYLYFTLGYGGSYSVKQNGESCLEFDPEAVDGGHLFLLEKGVPCTVEIMGSTYEFTTIKVNSYIGGNSTKYCYKFNVSSLDAEITFTPYSDSSLSFQYND